VAVVAWIAAGSFVGSMLLLVAYFRTERTWLGWAESLAFLLLYISLGVLIVGVHGEFVESVPAVVWAATIVGVVGAAVALSAETATLFLDVPFGRVAIPVTAAFGGILLWMGGISVAGLIGETLPTGLGWLGVGMVALTVVLIGVMSRDPALLRSERVPTPGELAMAAVPFLAIACWLVWFGAVL
jgi:hypothetical protein